MNKVATILYVSFLIMVGADMITSFIALQQGYVELNPLYYIIGPTLFWILYIILNTVLMVTLMIVEQKYWWVYLIILIPTIVHLACVINNVGLLY